VREVGQQQEEELGGGFLLGEQNQQPGAKQQQQSRRLRGEVGRAQETDEPDVLVVLGAQQHQGGKKQAPRQQQPRVVDRRALGHSQEAHGAADGRAQ